MQNKNIILKMLINEYENIKKEYEEIDITYNQEQIKKLDRISYLLFGLSIFEVTAGIYSDKLILNYLAFLTSLIGVMVKTKSYNMKPKIKGYLLEEIPDILDYILEEIEKLKEEIYMDEKILYKNTNLERIRK